MFKPSPTRPLGSVSFLPSGARVPLAGGPPARFQAQVPLAPWVGPGPCGQAAHPKARPLWQALARSWALVPSPRPPTLFSHVVSLLTYETPLKAKTSTPQTAAAGHVYADLQLVYTKSPGWPTCRDSKSGNPLGSGATRMGVSAPVSRMAPHSPVGPRRALSHETKATTGLPLSCDIPDRRKYIFIYLDNLPKFL